MKTSSKPLRISSSERIVHLLLKWSPSAKAIEKTAKKRPRSRKLLLKKRMTIKKKLRIRKQIPRRRPKKKLRRRKRRRNLSRNRSLKPLPRIRKKNNLKIRKSKNLSTIRKSIIIIKNTNIITTIKRRKNLRMKTWVLLRIMFNKRGNKSRLTTLISIS